MPKASSGKKTADGGGGNGAGLALTAENLAKLAAIFLAGVVAGVIGPRQWLPAIARGEDPEIKGLEGQLRLKDVQISSLEAQVNLFKSVADTTKQQNEDVLTALKQASAGSIDLQRRIESERAAKDRAEANAQSVRTEMHSLANSAPDLENLGLWAHGRPTASARALARTLVLPSEAQRPALVAALSQENKGIESQKELVILLHKNKQEQERCQKAEVAQQNAFDQLTIPIPVCLPTMKLAQCDQLFHKWTQDLDDLNRKYSEAGDEFARCQVSQISLKQACPRPLRGPDSGHKWLHENKGPDPELPGRACLHQLATARLSPPAPSPRSPAARSCRASS